MRNKIKLLENGTREEACIAFDKCKSGISDFSKESVLIKGDVKNNKEGWSVFKTYK